MNSIVTFQTHLVEKKVLLLCVAHLVLVNTEVDCIVTYYAQKVFSYRLQKQVDGAPIRGNTSSHHFPFNNPVLLTCLQFDFESNKHKLS